MGVENPINVISGMKIGLTPDREDSLMRKDHGLTLIEVMVVLGIIAIISAVAVPNMIDWRGKRQLEAAVNEVQTAIGLAKSTAIKRSTTVSILFTDPVNGITVFVDDNADGAIDGGDRVVRSFQFADGVTLSTLPALTFISFDARGFTTAVGISVEKAQDPRRPRVEVTVAGSSRINWG
jgi:type IV fimbrial biogenesis protein FimT